MKARTRPWWIGLVALAVVGCSPPLASPTPTGPPAPSMPTTSSASSPEPTVATPTRTVHRGTTPVSIGSPIDMADLSGRIVFDDFEDVFAMDVDGSNVVTIASNPAGSEFDGAWSPDGEWVVYRDSTRGMNVDDEIFIARADGSERRNLTNNPANDWGPDWSPDGTTIVFNSDRGGGAIRGWFVNPDGSDLRPVGVDSWFEYPSWSSDGTRIVFEAATGATTRPSCSTSRVARSPS